MINAWHLAWLLPVAGSVGFLFGVLLSVNKEG